MVMTAAKRLRMEREEALHLGGVAAPRTLAGPDDDDGWRQGRRHGEAETVPDTDASVPYGPGEDEGRGG